MKKDDTDFFRLKVFPFLGGLGTYLIISKLIPKEWNIFGRYSRSKTDSFTSGFLNGIGAINHYVGVFGSVVFIKAIDKSYNSTTEPSPHVLPDKHEGKIKNEVHSVKSLF